MLEKIVKSATTVCFLILAFAAVPQAQVCQPAPVGLVSWWSGDGNALDSRSRNNGTPQNGATFGAGHVGQAFGFDGSDDRVIVADAANLSPQVPANGEITLSAWVNLPALPTADPNTGNAERTVLAKGGNAGVAYEYEIVINTIGAVGMRIYQFEGNLHSSVTSNVPPGGFTLNQWHLVTGTMKRGQFTRIYFDGNLLAENTGFSGAFLPTDTNASVFIGARGDGQNLNGQVDEATIYNRALSTSEIAAIHTAGTAGKCKPTATVAPGGQVAWWSGDGNANDISGSGNNGTLEDGAGFAVGRVGQSFSFDGGNDSVQVPTTAINFGTGDFTIDLWFNQNSVSAIGNSLFGKTIGTFPNDQTYLLETFNGNLVRFLVRGTTANENDLNVPVSLPTNTWHHVVAVRQGNINRLYLNGLQIGQQTAGSNVNTGTGGAAFIGRLAEFSTRFFDGRIDETSLYNRALTDAEITSIFNAGIAGKLKETTTTGTTASVGDATVTYPNSATRTTQQIPLDLALFPALPINHVSTGLTYDIATSSITSGTVGLCFNLQAFAGLTQAEFFERRILHLEGGVWTNSTHFYDFAGKVICARVPSLSPFAIVDSNLAPTAANVSVGGRVVTAMGRGISNARVSIVDSDGNTKTALTGAFGYYQFDDIRAGEIYFVSVQSKRYQFAEPTQTVHVFDQISNLDFTASP